MTIYVAHFYRPHCECHSVMDILGLTTEEFEALTPQEQQQTTALVDDVLTSDNVDGSSLNALAALVRLIAYSRHRDLPESLSITFDPVGKFCASVADCCMF